jgi:RNA polymerase sigma-70 factor (ECF subfamily)
MAAAPHSRNGRQDSFQRPGSWLLVLGSGRARRRVRCTKSRYAPLTVRGEQFEGVLTGARSGAEWAIAALYREFHPRLLRYLRAQEPVDGEDLAAEAWLDAAQGLRRFKGDELAFQRWVFTIARRRLIDFRRRRSRSARAVGALRELVDQPDLEGAGARVLAESETDAALARIASLPSDQADVVLLRVVAGLDVADVARILGKNPGAVRVLQHRALHRLAEQLAREGRAVTR